MSLGKINEKLLSQLHGRVDGQQPLNEASAYVQAYQKAVAEVSNGTSNVTVSDFNKYYVLTAYTSIHQRVSEKLKKIINSVDGIRDFYLVEVMLSQLTEDALAPKIGSDEIIRLSHKDPEVQEFINDMKERIGLDQMLENITPDLCSYGDYVLETDIDVGNGLRGLYDSIDQGATIPLIQDGRIDGYLHVDEVTGEITKRELADFVHFTLGGQRIKVRFDTTLPMLVKNNAKLRQFYKKTPKYLRVGRSMLYPVLGKLRELELLEKLVPATKINKLSQGNMIGVPVPADYDLNRGFDAAKQIENNINRKVMVDNTMKEITVEAILSTAGRTRVVPIFGDKGRLEKLDYKADEADDMFSNCGELRDTICDSIGVPSELIFKSKDGASKNDLLKRYAKYLRKLKKIQKSIISGVRQIISIHLANSEKYKHIDPMSVDIVLNNHLVEIDNLDRLEHADITISFVKNVKEFFDELQAKESPYAPFVKLEKVVEFIEAQLKTVGLADAIETTKEKVQAGEITQQQADLIDDVENKEMMDVAQGKADDVPQAYSDIPFDPTKPPAPKTEGVRARIIERRNPHTKTGVKK